VQPFLLTSSCVWERIVHLYMTLFIFKYTLTNQRAALGPQTRNHCTSVKMMCSVTWSNYNNREIRAVYTYTL